MRHVLPCLPLFFDFLRNVGFGSERANEREETNRKRVVRERDCEIFFCQKKRSKKADLLPYYIDCSVFGVCVFSSRIHRESNGGKRK